MRQFKLFDEKIPLKFGGELLAGKRKSKRPLCSKRPIHLVLHSEEALKRGSFRKYESSLLKLWNHQIQKYGLTLYKISVNSNHIHAVIKIPDRRSYMIFIKSLTSKIVKLLNGSKNFFTYRPFTRILSWGREFRAVLNYVKQNILEAIGAVAYKPRKRKPMRRDIGVPLEGIAESPFSTFGLKAARLQDSLD